MSDILQQLLPLIEPLARSIARSYPGVEADDVYQELALFVLQHGNSLDPENEGGCRHILSRAGHLWASEERAKALGLTCQYNYRPADVRRILETGALDSDREQWVNVHVPEDAKSLKGSAAIEVTLDVRAALDELDWQDRGAVVLRYYNGVVHEAGSPQRKALDKAIERLCEALNGYSQERLRRMEMRGYTGSRRAITNAAAMARISEAY